LGRRIVKDAIGIFEVTWNCMIGFVRHCWRAGVSTLFKIGIEIIKEDSLAENILRLFGLI
jgi:hypothetical protein